ncbi:MAG: hypothetical protein CVT83_03570, partial [Alphaproteobacteria bacterium HGW-Alphaproteobacteria-5]
MLHGTHTVAADAGKKAEMAIGRPDKDIRGLIRQVLFKNRMQLAGGLLFSVLLPVALRFNLTEVPLTQSSLTNTIAGTTVALIVGFLFFRRLSDYPGTGGISYAIPVFTLTYSAILIFFFFTRLDYSRYLFAISYILAVVWFTAMSIATVKLRT